MCDLTTANSQFWSWDLKIGLLAYIWWFHIIPFILKCDYFVFKFLMDVRLCTRSCSPWDRKYTVALDWMGAVAVRRESKKKYHSLDKEVLTQWSLASIRSLSLQEGPTSGQSGNWTWINAMKSSALNHSATLPPYAHDNIVTAVLFAGKAPHACAYACALIFISFWLCRGFRHVSFPQNHLKIAKETLYLPLLLK